MATEKSHVPAYVSFKSLETYFNQRREDGHVTDVVDKSLMTNFSGSTANELLSALKYLNLIKDKGEPTEKYKELVNASEQERPALVAAILRGAYTFLFDTTKFNLERATTAQLAEAFRGQGANGSTLARGIAFFLAAAKFANIKVSPNLKVPPGLRTARPKKDATKAAVNGGGAAEAQREEPEEGEEPDDPQGQVFYIPIPIDRKVKIVIPAQWAPSDWDRLTKMLELYVEGWKELASAAQKATEKDKGPTP